MALDRPRQGDSSAHPGEPGVGVDLSPPFVAEDAATRWLFSLNRFGIRPGLQRVEGLLSDLGHPETDLRTLVTAGTNGKGSTTRILARLLEDAGYKVVTYTSPHLLKVYERITINDVPIDPEDFSRRVTAIRPLTEKYEASWFETLTALAVQVAKDEQADFLCCEAGLGGRLDASNALPAVATLLTTVSLDHQRILGESRPEIAAEKLGLLKRNTPLFCGLDADLRDQAFRAAILSGSPAYFLEELSRRDRDAAAGTWQLTLREHVYPDLPDPGTEAMRRNISLALLALTELGPRLDKGLLPADIPASLGNLFLPGRYQSVLLNPHWIFDTAHNPEALSAVLTEFTARPTSGRRVLVFGAMYDKDLPTELTELARRFDHVIGVPVSLPRARTGDELEALFNGWGLGAVPWSGQPDLPACSVAPTIGEALTRLGRHLVPADEVLVTGSCFTVAEVLFQLGLTDLEQTRRARPAADVLG